MIEVLNENYYEEIVNLGKILDINFKNIYSRASLFNEYTKVIGYKYNDRIIGFLHYEILPDTISIINLVVNKSHRREHIATFLMDYFLSDIGNIPVNNIILEVRKDNDAAINLYKKFNFKIINIRKKYYKNIDGYVMERRII